MLTNKNSENRDKTIAYIRVSSQRQVDEGVSLDAQKRRILDYDTLLSGSNYTFLDLIDDTITAAVQKTVDSVEKQAKKTVKKVNKVTLFTRVLSMTPRGCK